MSAHTTWYPADEAAEPMYPEPLRPDRRADPNGPMSSEHRQSMSNMPFRWVAPATDTPYPIHDSRPSKEQQHIVDLLSGQRFQRADIIRQPMAEDFLQSHRSLPAPPVRRHDSDQDLPIIEPDSYFPRVSASDRLYSRSQSAGSADLTRRERITSPKPLPAVDSDPTQQHPVSAAAIFPHEFDETEVEDCVAPAPAMESDMFSPALGGLHRLESAPIRRPSRLGRLKRFFSAKGRHQYGRPTR
ncbi:hypothetical protein BDU57DRAFT_527539 [Ampelomyces quisqualis]|uniref:Uncharacterized protein n=1 Tax=Ampelomyces quisqualis TaxID=50730 RepID=A0A6A5QVM8_AMPQU|nr:hypothetical protein BDU57DRAFT_527539 [Ampelomyces quisqualis]